MSNLSKIINKVVQKILVEIVGTAENDGIFQGRNLDQFCAHHKTCCTVSPPITQLSTSIDFKKLSHKIKYQFNSIIKNLQ